MLRSHRPSRAGANPRKSQPGSRKRPEAGTMGEGDAGSRGPAGPAAAPGQSARAQPRGSAGPRRAAVAASTKPRAGQRAALPSARSYPPPARRRSPSPCQAEAGKAASRTPPASRAPARQRPGRGGRRFCCRPQLRRPGAARGEVLRASPIRPGASSARPLPPPAARASDGDRAGPSASSLPAPHPRHPPRGSGGLGRT